MGGICEGIWGCAQTLTVFNGDGTLSRSFRGFIEALELSDSERELVKKPGLIAMEKYRLVSDPDEDFYEGKASQIEYAGYLFKILYQENIYVGDIISHKECVLLKTGEVKSNA